MEEGLKKNIVSMPECPGCHKRIGFLNNFNEETEIGEYFVCKIKLKLFKNKVVKIGG